jgi:Cd2+/Zn2+-exporting ATPase
MSSLMSIAPQKAVMAETKEEVDADEVKLNTVLAVKAGLYQLMELLLMVTVKWIPDSVVWVGTINLNGVNTSL